MVNIHETPPWDENIMEVIAKRVPMIFDDVPCKMVIFVMNPCLNSKLFLFKYKWDIVELLKVRSI